MGDKRVRTCGKNDGAMMITYICEMGLGLDE